MLINLLILFFIILLSYQIILAIYDHYIFEGMDNNTTTDTSGNTDISGNKNEYKPYNDNDALILAKQNAGNIEVLRGRVDEVMNLKQEFMDISLNVSNLNNQVSALYQQQQSYAQNVNGGKPIEITGTTSDSSSS